MEIPVYLVSGFLESGKTSFIKEILKDQNFSEGERTLLIICEEGVEEFEEGFLKEFNCDVVFVEEEEDFTVDFLKECYEKYKPQRALLECNGMWEMETFYKTISRPWAIAQIITTIDSKTFDVYMNNMKQLFVSHALSSNLIIVNRCDENSDVMTFRRVIKGINRRSEIFFENTEGLIMELGEENLPFDINADIIEIDDEDYGLWYIDVMDHPEKYHGKTVKVKGMYYKPENYPEGSYVHGREAMTCCEDDISLIGVLCISSNKTKLKEREWIYLTGKIECRHNEQLGESMAIIIEDKIEKAEEPKDKLVTFS